VLQILDKWLSKKKKRTDTRLSKDEALAIARKAASVYPNAEELYLVSLEEKAGVLIWIVSSTTVGRTLFVKVDDASGDVIEIKQVGLR
jgi:uncharacterized membrane protein YkoI